MYISVKETAKKFKLSKRRVQALCEQNRIQGSKLSNGVWLIPKDSKKPIDARIKTSISQKCNSLPEEYLSKDYLSIKDICEILSISQATAKNWIKLGKIKPDINNCLFNKNDIELLYKNIKNGSDNKLKNRRNKKNIVGNLVYNDYISNENNKKVVYNIINSFNTFTNDELKFIIANFSIQLYNKINSANDFKCFDIAKTSNYTNSTTLNCLITDLLKDIDFATLNNDKLYPIITSQLEYNKAEDTLGFIYISLRNLNNIKQSGAYYTPKKIVTTLLDSLLSNENTDLKTFCDPCCGTGNFLISLYDKGIKSAQIYGQDIDDISIFITRINMFFLDSTLTTHDLYSHFTIGNALSPTFNKKFNIILGNPPWGYDFSKGNIDYLLKNFYTAKKKGMESFDLFIEKGFDLLEKEGYLYYVLPESLLNVKSHNQSREIILKNASFKYINFLGNAFSGVQCPSIILGLKKDNFGNTENCNIVFNNQSFTLKTNRNVNPSCFSFNLTDDEYNCLQKIESTQNAEYLSNKAKFALGIVTGDNQKYVTTTKSPNNEIILKGSNIYKYSIKSSDNYIEYKPNNFQQVAPTEIYKANEKLLYRFISETPVFAYDNNQLLSLNSCNILIPQIENMEIKYILAILNSSVSAFYLNKKFNSIKLLRNHIESIPIPKIGKLIQNKIIEKVDNILNSQENILELYNELDNDIFELYNFSTTEKNVIKNALSNKASFII